MRAKWVTLWAALVGVSLVGCGAEAIDDDEEAGSGAHGDTGTPAGDHCSPTEGWDSQWVALEDEVLAIVNMHRAAGASCGGEAFGPAPALVMQANLRCAARLHSMDMHERGYFAHETPDGQSPWDRMEEAGYVDWRAVAENIAAGSPTADGVMQGWMSSTGHCRNIMNGDLTEIGIGYFPGGDFGHLWTQKFGRR
jgi:uncharacterized protein YkwD